MWKGRIEAMNTQGSGSAWVEEEHSTEEPGRSSI